jgi:hypothetical protein
MDKNAFLWFGILTITLSFVLLSGYTFIISDTNFVVFLGVILMPISMASFAAGILEGSRMRVLTIFLVYMIFFGIIFLAPNFIYS